MNWINGEKGPQCFCGGPTSVVVDEDVNLMCFLHKKAFAALFPLPKDGRPDHFPNVTNAEMKVLVELGLKEQNGYIDNS